MSSKCGQLPATAEYYSMDHNQLDKILRGQGWHYDDSWPHDGAHWDCHVDDNYGRSNPYFVILAKAGTGRCRRKVGGESRWARWLIDLASAGGSGFSVSPDLGIDLDADATKLPRRHSRAGRLWRGPDEAQGTAYGTGRFLGWLIKDKRITPHIPVWEKGGPADGIFARSDFKWDRRRGVYICPNGKQLRTSGTVHDGRTLLYRASKRDCDACPLRAKCCTREEARKIPRDLHEDARPSRGSNIKVIGFMTSSLPRIGRVAWERIHGAAVARYGVAVQYLIPLAI